MSINPFYQKLDQFKKARFQDNLKLVTTVSQMRTYGKAEKEYQVPIHEIPIWIDNGWKFNEQENKMYRKGRESVNVQQSKANQL
jgi:hypothetical protein